MSNFPSCLFFYRNISLKSGMISWS
ncbi:hypothetical protein Ocin01_09370 [Orchesella cincta]|uniref:Uncharacterized protein n=1 Tax=Orchesella cincta TaxID=48709 RepID=A0A1D2MW84_ORCCI|nr:hypothetical protein Ocin01_09370 [Orchesella cincta]